MGEAAESQDVAADLGVSRALSLAATLLDAAPGGLTKSEILARVDLYAAQEGTPAAFERMFSRDKQYLRANGVEITERLPSGAVRGEHDHRYLIAPETYGLPEVQLDAAEAAALRRVRLLWSGSRAQQSILQVAGVLGAETTGEGTVDQRVRSHRMRLGEDAELDRLQRLVELGTEAAISFDYAARGARTPARRRVRPWGWGVRDRWYLVGHDLDREALRTFRLDRIRGSIVRAQPAPAVSEGIADSAEHRRREVIARLDAAADPRRGEAWVQRLQAVARLQTEAPAPPDRLAAVRSARRTDPAPQKIARLLNMAAHLEVTGGSRVSTLLERFGLTAAQLHRDLLSLQQVGRFDADRFGEFIDLTPEIPLNRAEFTEVMAAEDPVIGIRLPPGPTRGAMARPLRLTTPEALSVLIGLEGLLTEGADPGALSLRSTIRAIVPASVAEAAEELSVAWSLDGDPQLHHRLTEAVQTGRAVALDYRDRAGVPSRRLVEPVRLIHDGPRSYLQAWCRTAEAERHFRLSRIRSAEILADQGLGPEAADLAAAEPRPLQAPNAGELSAVVWAAPAAAAEVRRWAPTHAAEDADGGLFARIRVPSAEVLHRLILDADGDVALLAPAQAVESLRRWVEDQLAHAGAESRMLEDDERTAP